jgi:hypothetical protein
VVAALTHFPTSYQRAKVIKFSNEGNAAITQNCPLYGVAAIPQHFQKTLFFRSSHSARNGACVSLTAKNGASHFLAVGVCNMVLVCWFCGSETRYLQTWQGDDWNFSIFYLFPFQNHFFISIIIFSKK